MAKPVQGNPRAPKSGVPFKDPSHAHETGLWERVKRTIDPLDAKQRALYSQALEDFLESSAQVDKANLKKPDQRKASEKTQSVNGLPIAAAPTQRRDKAKASSKSSTPNPIVALDRKVKKRIARGTVPIDATIDLHGMRQHEAEAALRHFIWRSQSRSLRTLLIITGKGSRTAPRRELDPPWAAETGVLRKAVPQWLSAPDLRAAVLSFEPANQNHGGSGALYVRLRAKTGGQGR
ncbi:MAG: Smr/MutS family protein [Pseudomonadota bacterium]